MTTSPKPLTHTVNRRHALTELQAAQHSIERCTFSTDLTVRDLMGGDTVRDGFIRWASSWVTPRLVQAAYDIGGEITVDPHFASFLGQYERTHGARVAEVCTQTDLAHGKLGKVPAGDLR